MSGDEQLDHMIDDLIEQYLLHLRGRGPEPDLSVLPADCRAELTEQLRIVDALADRDPELPPIEDDPVAMRLGLVDRPSPDQVSNTRPAAPDDDCGSDDDPVRVSLRDLAFRFDNQIEVDFAPVWASAAPAGMRPVGQCTALGEVVAVLVADVAGWSHEPEPVARFFRDHDISAVGLVSADAERAVVIMAADAHHSVDPVRGWLAPHSPAPPEPLGIALGRHFDRCLPAWDRVAGLDERLGLGDLITAAWEVTCAQIAVAQRARPRLRTRRRACRR